MNNGEQIYSNSLKVGLVFCLILIPVLFISHFTTYNNTSYQIYVTHSYLEGALDTNNIQKKAEMVDQTLVKLRPYSGNSDWWFPKEQTNIDITKELLTSVSENLRQQIPVQDREQWMILPHNELNAYVNGEVTTSLDRIDAYASAYYWNPNSSPMLILVWLCTCVWLGWVVAGIVGAEKYGW